MSLLTNILWSPIRDLVVFLVFKVLPLALVTAAATTAAFIIAGGLFSVICLVWWVLFEVAVLCVKCVRRGSDELRPLLQQVDDDDHDNSPT